jgi:hypothetical protein
VTVRDMANVALFGNVPTVDFVTCGNSPSRAPHAPLRAPPVPLTSPLPASLTHLL